MGFGLERAPENPRTILTNNDSAYTNFIPRVEPPEEDGDLSDEDPISPTNRDRTNETMRYRVYYGIPDSQQQVFAPLDARGFSSTNMSFLGDPSEEDGGLWSGGGGGGGNIKSTTSKGNPTSPGSMYVPSTFDETILDTRTVMAQNKGSRDGGKKVGGSKEGAGGVGTIGDIDAFGGGRSFLLRELKAKFIELSTPLTRFVTRYCALSGVTSSDKALHQYIQVRSLFTRAEENNDWEGLIKGLYGKDTGAYDGNFSSEGGSGLDTSELADAILQMIADEEAAIKRINSGKATDVAREEANRIIRANETIKSRTAAMLRQSYNNMATGKVVFLLDPILRESAQSLLDVINENYRGTYSKPNFTLLEVMRSSAVMTTFIKLMLITKQTSNMLGVVPITPNPYSGIYGTLADRITSGAENSGRLFTSGTGYNSLTVVQSRPTVANMVAGSMEYNAGLRYFANVDYARDGSGGLIFVDPSKKKKYEQDEEEQEGSYHRSSQEIYFDSYSGVYKKRRIDSKGHYTIQKSESHDNWTPPFDKDEAEGGRVYRSHLPSKPIETLQDALSRNAMYSEQSHISQRYNPQVLSYRDKEGRLKLVSKKILSDIRAITNFYNTGKVGQYHVDTY